MVTLYPRSFPGEPKPTEPRVVCDSAAKAVEALDELGLCMNWAAMVKADLAPMLIYQGWMYRNSHERFVELPFDALATDFAAQFKQLLQEMFGAYLANTNIHRSQIEVTPSPDDTRIFNVSLFLIFAPKDAESIAAVLHHVEDGHDDVPATIYWLD